MNAHTPGSSSDSKDLNDVEVKLLAVEGRREIGSRKPVPRPSLETEFEVESSMERGNGLLLQTKSSATSGYQTGSWRGGERDRGEGKAVSELSEC